MPTDEPHSQKGVTNKKQIKWGTVQRKKNQEMRPVTAQGNR